VHFVGLYRITATELKLPNSKHNYHLSYTLYSIYAMLFTEQ